MKVNDLIKQLMQYDMDSEVVMYDKDSDKTHEILCVDADEGDKSDEDSQVIINVYSFFAPTPEATPIAELPVFIGFSAIWT